MSRDVHAMLAFAAKSTVTPLSTTNSTAVPTAPNPPPLSTAPAVVSSGLFERLHSTE